MAGKPAGGGTHIIEGGERGMGHARSIHLTEMDANQPV